MIVVIDLLWLEATTGNDSLSTIQFMIDWSLLKCTSDTPNLFQYNHRFLEQFAGNFDQVENTKNICAFRCIWFVIRFINCRLTCLLDWTDLDQFRETKSYWRRQVLRSDYFCKLQFFAVAICCQKIIPHSFKTSDYSSHTPETFNKNILTDISWTKIFVVSNGRSSVRGKW